MNSLDHQTCQLVDHWFNDNQVWHEFSVNMPVGSCEEAAAARFRDGAVGIPLSDELKSLALGVQGPKLLPLNGNETIEKRLVLVHARGDDTFDFGAIARAVDRSRKKIRMLDQAELASELQADFGTVNPFSVAARGIRATHIFDSQTLSPSDSGAETMMTNAGTATSAVEFKPLEVIIPLRAQVVDIIKSKENGADNE